MERALAVRTARGFRAPVALFGTCTLIVVGTGWFTRDREYVSPEFGIGYALGIVGAGMMLALSSYTGRKNLRFMRSWGRVKPWFQVHQVLGILGPVCILFHANFKFGSTNSAVALLCMLTIVGSGVLGRFMYGKVHDHLSGRRRQLQELKARLETAKGRSTSILEAFETHAQKLHRAGASAPLRLAVLGLRRRWTHAVARRHLAAKASSGEADRLIGSYLRAVQDVAELSVYERLFAAWHVLHVPLFFMLILTSAVHVVAVHAY